MDFAIGKGKSLFPEWMRINVEVRVDLVAADGRTAFGCSADWPSFGWLDKRPDIEPRQKLVELLTLVAAARRAYLANAQFETPFDCWWKTQNKFLRSDAAQDAVPLCSSFALALLERAIVDAFCRLENLPFDESLRQNRLGFQPGKIHAELDQFQFSECLPKQPLNQINIRHTVGLNDPLTTEDVAATARLDDGRPQTLEDYLSVDGITHFKIKISGSCENDLARLQQIWKVVEQSNPALTLDGNEAYDDIAEFTRFVMELANQQTDVFNRILFIEQPMSRARTHDLQMKGDIESIAKLKPLIIARP